MNNGLTIRHEIDLMTLGDVLSKSGFFADSRQSFQAVVKVLAGQELGFGPVASMTGINIIKGRVTLSANLLAAAIKRSGRYTYRVVELSAQVCTLEFLEEGKLTGKETFTMEDAKRAGLQGENWTKYPKNMLFARAISNGAKFYCPDIFGGPVYTPDELGAVIDGETGEMIADDPEPPQIIPPSGDDRRIGGNPKDAPKTTPKAEMSAAALKPSEVDEIISYAMELRPDIKSPNHAAPSCLKALGISDWTDPFSGTVEDAKALVKARAEAKKPALIESGADADAAR